MQTQQNGYHPATPPYVSQSLDSLKSSANEMLPQTKKFQIPQSSIQFTREKSHLHNGVTEVI